MQALSSQRTRCSAHPAAGHRPPAPLPGQPLRLHPFTRACRRCAPSRFRGLHRSVVPEADLGFPEADRETPAAPPPTALPPKEEARHTRCSSDLAAPWTPMPSRCRRAGRIPAPAGMPPAEAFCFRRQPRTGPTLCQAGSSGPPFPAQDRQRPPWPLKRAPLHHTAGGKRRSLTATLPAKCVRAADAARSPGGAPRRETGRLRMRRPVRDRHGDLAEGSPARGLRQRRLRRPRQQMALRDVPALPGNCQALRAARALRGGQAERPRRRDREALCWPP